MNSEDLVFRMERFERTVATCLCIVPALFAAQCFFEALGAPVFENMFKEFGAKLPALTEFALHTWALWLVFSVIVPTSAIIVARKKPAMYSLVFSTVTGVVMFVISQTLAAALFLPIWQLGAVAGGLSK